MPSSVDDRTLAERMRHALPGMSPGERRIVRLCLSITVPEQVATVSVLAETAGVSSPTVLRCLNKIGFEHFGDFRDVVMAELSEKHESALAQMNRRTAGPAEGHETIAMRDNLNRSLVGTFERLDLGELSAAIDLISDPQRRQMFTGGRFSHSVAELLYAHISLVRPGCDLLAYNNHGRNSRLVDVGRSHVLTVFDFRRYQRDTVELARAAKQRRAKLVLITDQWMSPIADWADAVLVAEVRSVSPFDSLVPALALVETIIDQVHSRLGSAATERLAQFESENVDFEWNSLSATGSHADRSAESEGE